MNLKRVSVLLRKELLQGPKNFMFVYAFVMPVVVSLVVSLVFGTLFDDKASLGIVDEGDSQLVPLLMASPSLQSTEYGRITELREAVTEGAVDGGLVLAADFDNSVIRGERAQVPVYIWGESLAKHRTTISVTLADSIRELSGQESPIDLQQVTLGDEMNIPWNDRLLPFIVLMAVTMAGLALTGTSLLAEKEKKTVDALVTTPATIGEVYLAKGLLGVIVGTLMGVVILVINQALGGQPGLLIMLLFLGSAMAAGIGLLAASLAKNLTSFFATMKVMGILLYAPAIVYMFPSIPQWIGQIFPTYYIVNPIVEISQRGGGWPEIAVDIFILIGLNVALVALIAFTVSKKRQYAL